MTQLGIKVDYVNLRKDYYNLKSGLCKVKGEHRIIIDKYLHLSEKIDVLIAALSEFDLDGLYMQPYVRRLFEKRQTVPGGEPSPQHIDNHPAQ